jgi:hypothetical protein
MWTLQHDDVQKCDRCHFRSGQDERVLDEDGMDIGSRTVCRKCGHVMRDDIGGGTVANRAWRRSVKVIRRRLTRMNREP